jgi:hypothetical protein
MRLNSKVFVLALNTTILAGATLARAQTAAPAAPVTPTQNVQQNVPATATTGQIDRVFNQGESVLSAGLALGGINGSAGSMSVPPIFVSYDFGLTPDFSLGAAASYYQASADYGYGRDWKYSYTTLAVRGDYHFGRLLPIEKLDLYGGLLLGYGIVSVSAPSNFPGSAGVGSTANLVVWGASLGARYYFTKSLAAQVELGVGLGNLGLGLAYKI